MKWHIITSSKGGTGKTLLSLLLLANCLEEEKRKNGSTLILDMNGMNTDSSAIVLYKTIAAEPKNVICLELKTDLTLYHQDADSINFQIAYADDSQGQTQKYVIGGPANPFLLMNPQLFADFLKTITANAEQIENDLGLSSPLRYVIIDTNYHFCNIFAQDDKLYIENYNQGLLQGEEINIWFLWVYRQFEKLVDKHNSNYANTIRATAASIEKHLKGSYCQPGNISTPLIHVFTPAGLMISPEQGGWILQSLGIKKNQEYYVVPELKSLEDLEIGECIDFNQWLVFLNQAYHTILEQFNEESAILFPKALVEAVKRSSSGDEQRPQNIIPLSVHEKSLEHYTDKERTNAVARLRRLEIYKHLVKLL